MPELWLCSRGGGALYHNVIPRDLDGRGESGVETVRIAGSPHQNEPLGTNQVRSLQSHEVNAGSDGRGWLPLHSPVSCRHPFIENVCDLAAGDVDHGKLRSAFRWKVELHFESTGDRIGNQAKIEICDGGTLN